MQPREAIEAMLRSERLALYQGGVIALELLQDLEPMAAPWQGAADLADAIADHWAGDLADTLDRVGAMEPTADVGTDAIRLAGPLARVRRDLHGGGWASIHGLGLSGWDLAALHAAGILRVVPRYGAAAFAIEFNDDATLRGL